VPVKLSDFPALAAAVEAFIAADPPIRTEGDFVEPDYVPVERASVELSARELAAADRIRKAAR
jgi:hypothetical protein